jgi:hypothetical protein
LLFQFFIGMIMYTFFMESLIWKQEIFDYSHVPGCAVLHHGRHRHGSRATIAGHRVNLLLWCKRCFHILFAFITGYISLIYLVIVLLLQRECWNIIKYLTNIFYINLEYLGIFLSIRFILIIIIIIIICSWFRIESVSYK